jgi:hypothetical protein
VSKHKRFWWPFLRLYVKEFLVELMHYKLTQGITNSFNASRPPGPTPFITVPQVTAAQTALLQDLTLLRMWTTLWLEKIASPAAVWIQMEAQKAVETKRRFTRVSL